MWESIKKLLKTDKDKAILMEDGQPRYVVLSVKEYLKLVDESSSQDIQSRVADVYQGAPSLSSEEYPGYSEELNVTDVFENELPPNVVESENLKGINIDDLPV